MPGSAVDMWNAEFARHCTLVGKRKNKHLSIEEDAHSAMDHVNGRSQSHSRHQRKLPGWGDDIQYLPVYASLTDVLSQHSFFTKIG